MYLNICVFYGCLLIYCNRMCMCVSEDKGCVCVSGYCIRRCTVDLDASLDIQVCP